MGQKEKGWGVSYLSWECKQLCPVVCCVSLLVLLFLILICSFDVFYVDARQ